MVQNHLKREKEKKKKSKGLEIYAPSGESVLLGYNGEKGFLYFGSCNFIFFVHYGSLDVRQI